MPGSDNAITAKSQNKSKLYSQTSEAERGGKKERGSEG